ncbi:DUF2958 domain-containing protein [Dyadobacter sp. CY323]|uniref:DUF2958 domain-containing protein n=1 Tax=Dyadobacter sp. CY323 TaxID=2907302 RepID=UPI001F287379|nr:DUF2958 domain-containing protein [Dyadobacter sp. CY323]MCE6991509.1 DUF2958 domain-containing protein [Dyadobacter sp. CY323]
MMISLSGCVTLEWVTRNIGNVSTSELEAACHPKLGIQIERDLYFTPSYPMSVYAEAARMFHQVTDDQSQLAIAQLSMINRMK